jgi:hypothetical protein
LLLHPVSIASEVHFICSAFALYVELIAGFPTENAVRSDCRYLALNGELTSTESPMSRTVAGLSFSSTPGAPLLPEIEGEQ